MSRSDHGASSALRPMWRRSASISQLPAFWVTCAAIFLANAVLASLYGELVSAVLGLVTTGVSLLAALMTRRHVRRDIPAWAPPPLPPPRPPS